MHLGLEELRAFSEEKLIERYEEIVKEAQEAMNMANQDFNLGLPANVVNLRDYVTDLLCDEMLFLEDLLNEYCRWDVVVKARETYSPALWGKEN